MKTKTATTAQSQPKPSALTEHHKANFETIGRAAENGDLCIVSAIHKATGRNDALLCAMQTNEDRTFTPVPLAVMINEDPFEAYHDPTVI